MSLVTDAINEQRCTISELPQLCSMLHSRVVVVVVFVGRCDPSNLPHAPPTSPFSVMRPYILQSSLLLLLLFLSAVGAAFNSKFAAAVTVFWRWLDKAS